MHLSPQFVLRSWHDGKRKRIDWLYNSQLSGCAVNRYTSFSSLISDKGATHRVFNASRTLRPVAISSLGVSKINIRITTLNMVTKDKDSMSFYNRLRKTTRSRKQNVNMEQIRRVAVYTV